MITTDFHTNLSTRASSNRVLTDVKSNSIMLSLFIYPSLPPKAPLQFVTSHRFTTKICDCTTYLINVKIVSFTISCLSTNSFLFWLILILNFTLQLCEDLPICSPLYYIPFSLKIFCGTKFCAFYLKIIY